MRLGQKANEPIGTRFWRLMDMSGPVTIKTYIRFKMLLLVLLACSPVQAKHRKDAGAIYVPVSSWRRMKLVSQSCIQVAPTTMRCVFDVDFVEISVKDEGTKTFEFQKAKIEQEKNDVQKVSQQSDNTSR